MALLEELRENPTKCNTISCCLLAICVLLIMLLFLVVHGDYAALDNDLKADRTAEKKMGFFAYLGSLFHPKKKSTSGFCASDIYGDAAKYLTGEYSSEGGC